MNKDVYLKIASEMDDKDVLSMLSVNRKFNDPKFFQQIMIQRYPLLIKFRKENEDWKQLYLRMVTYILKLKEEYDVDYITAPSFNPKRVYYDFKTQEGYDPEFFEGYSFNEILKYIGESGNEELIQEAIEDNDLNLEDGVLSGMNYLLDGIVKGGHVELLRKYGTKFRPGYFTIKYAVSSGNEDMIRYIENLFKETGKGDEESALANKRKGAVESGNLDLVKRYRYIDKKYLVEPITSKDTGECFDHVFAEAGSFEVFQYLLNNICDFDDLPNGMSYPFVENEKIEWLRYFIEFYRKSKFYDLREFRRLLKNLIENAIQYNATDILKYLKDVRNKYAR